MKELAAKIAVLNTALNMEATADDVHHYENCGYLTVNTCRNGQDVVWYVDEQNNVAMEIATGKFLTAAEIEAELE